MEVGRAFVFRIRALYLRHYCLLSIVTKSQSSRCKCYGNCDGECECSSMHECG
jgi:hypothetical protein